jgi:hypothetical protein
MISAKEKDDMTTRRNSVPIFWSVLLGFLLSSCASTAPADLEKLVRVFNVYRIGGEELPRKVDGCEYVDVVSASAPTLERDNSITLSDPKVILETIRARAHSKGADTAFVSIATPIVKNPNGLVGPLAPGTVSDTRKLRATIFRCGDSSALQAFGSPLG